MPVEDLVEIATPLPCRWTGLWGQYLAMIPRVPVTLSATSAFSV
jgi:hypothetical protein